MGGGAPPGRGPHGQVASARAAYFSVCEVPTVVDLTGIPFEDAGDVALSSLDPGEDIHATAAYRAQLVRVLTRRVLQSAYDEVANIAGQQGVRT